MLQQDDEDSSTLLSEDSSTAQEDIFNVVEPRRFGTPKGPNNVDTARPLDAIGESLASFHEYLDEVVGSDDDFNDDSNISYDSIDQELGVSPQPDNTSHYQSLTPKVNTPSSRNSPVSPARRVEISIDSDQSCDVSNSKDRSSQPSDTSYCRGLTKVKPNSLTSYISPVDEIEVSIDSDRSYDSSNHIDATSQPKNTSHFHNSGPNINTPASFTSHIDANTVQNDALQYQNSMPKSSTPTSLTSQTCSVDDVEGSANNDRNYDSSNHTDTSPQPNDNYLDSTPKAINDVEVSVDIDHIISPRSNQTIHYQSSTPKINTPTSLISHTALVDESVVPDNNGNDSICDANFDIDVVGEHDNIYDDNTSSRANDDTDADGDANGTADTTNDADSHTDADTDADAEEGIMKRQSLGVRDYLGMDCADEEHIRNYDLDMEETDIDFFHSSSNVYSSPKEHIEAILEVDEENEQQYDDSDSEQSASPPPLQQWRSFDTVLRKNYQSVPSPQNIKTTANNPIGEHSSHHSTGNVPSPISTPRAANTTAASFSERPVSTTTPPLIKILNENKDSNIQKDEKLEIQNQVSPVVAASSSQQQQQQQQQQQPTNPQRREKPEKILSPFSPKARKIRRQVKLNQLSYFSNTMIPPTTPTDLKWGMGPCRKVSILVNVAPSYTIHSESTIASLEAKNNNHNNDNNSNKVDQAICLFPNIEHQPISDNLSLNSGNTSKRSLANFSVTSNLTNNTCSTMASSHYETGPGQELLLVNPNAFGKILPLNITVETARIVAQLSNKASEDWVRKFKFDEICWPEIKSLSSEVRNSHQQERRDIHVTMSDVSAAIVTDAASGKASSVVLGHGTGDCGRLESIFGNVASTINYCGDLDSENINQVVKTKSSISDQLGLLGLIVNSLLEQQEQQKEKLNKMTFTLSIIEIVKDDVLRDLLQNPSSTSTSSPSSSTGSPKGKRKRISFSPMKSVDNSHTKRNDMRRISSGDEKKTISLKIRHPDKKGAIVQNAEEVTIQSLDELQNLLSTAFFSPSDLSSRQMEGGRGHIIATLKVQPNEGQYIGVSETSLPTNDSVELKDYSLIQLVDLVSGDGDQTNKQRSDKAKLKRQSNTQLDEISKVKERRAASIRKSLSGLRGILRNLIVQDLQNENKKKTNVSYRECTLTKLLQRALDSPESRAVIISSVCPKQSSYSKTLNTLNYINRLLVRPSHTAESPFETTSQADNGSLLLQPGDQSVVVSSQASESIKTEFNNLKADKQFIKSFVSDPRQRLATIFAKESSQHKSNTSLGEVPLKEITTIQESVSMMENDIIAGDSKTNLSQMNDNNINGHDDDSLTLNSMEIGEKISFNYILPHVEALDDDGNYGDYNDGDCEGNDPNPNQDQTLHDRLAYSDDMLEDEREYEDFSVTNQNSLDSSDTEISNKENHHASELNNKFTSETVKQPRSKSVHFLEDELNVSQPKADPFGYHSDDLYSISNNDANHPQIKGSEEPEGSIYVSSLKNEIANLRRQVEGKHQGNKELDHGMSAQYIQKSSLDRTKHNKEILSQELGSSKYDISQEQIEGNTANMRMKQGQTDILFEEDKPHIGFNSSANVDNFTDALSALTKEVVNLRDHMKQEEREKKESDDRTNVLFIEKAVEETNLEWENLSRKLSPSKNILIQDHSETDKIDISLVQDYSVFHSPESMKRLKNKNSDQKDIKIVALLEKTGNGNILDTVNLSKVEDKKVEECEKVEDDFAAEVDQLEDSNFIHSLLQGSEDDIATMGKIKSKPLYKELCRLEKSMKTLLQSTKEPDLLSDLAEDQSLLQQSLNFYFNSNTNSADKNPYVRRMKQMTSQCDAMRYFVNSILTQLERSRRAENEANEEVTDLQAQIDETMDQVQALKSSSKSSLRGLRQDHLKVLKAATDITEDVYENKLDVIKSDHFRQISSLAEALENKDEDNEHLSQSISSMREQVLGLQQRLEMEEANKREMEYNHSQKLSKLSSSLKRKDEQEKELSQTLSNLIEENSSSRKALDSEEASRLQAQTDYSTQCEKNVKLTLEINTMKDVITRLQEQIDLKGNDKDEELISMRKKVESRDKNIAVADQLVDSLKKEVFELNQLCTKDKEMMQKATETHTAKINSLSKAIRNQENKSKELGEVIKLTEAELKDVRNQLNVSEVKRIDEGQALTNEINVLKLAKDRADTKEKELLKDISSSKDDFNALLDVNKDLKNKLELTESDMINLRSQLILDESERKKSDKMHIAEMKTLQEATKNAVIKEGKYQQDISSLKVENKGLINSKNELSEKVSDMEVKMMSLCHQLELQNKTSEQTTEAHKAKVDGLKQDLKNATVREKQLEQEISSLKSKNSILFNNKNEYSEKLLAMEKEVNILCNQLSLEKSGRKQSEDIHKMEIRSLKEKAKDTLKRERILRQEMSSLEANNLSLREESEKASMKRLSDEKELMRLHDDLALEEEKRNQLDEDHISKMNSLEDALATFERKEKELLVDISFLKNKNTALLSDKKETRQSVKSLEREIVELREKIIKKDEEKNLSDEAHLNKVQMLEETVSSYIVKEKELNQSLVGLKNENRDLLSMKKDLNEKVSSIEDEITNLHNQINQKKEEIEESTAIHLEEMNAIKKNLNDVIKREDKLQQNMLSLEHDNNRLQDSLENEISVRIQLDEKHSSEVTSLKKSLIKNTSRAKDLAVALSSAENKTLRLQENLDILQSEKHGAEKANNIEVQGLQEALNEANIACESLTQQIMTQNSDLSQVKKLLHAERIAKKSAEESYSRELLTMSETKNEEKMRMREKKKVLENNVKELRKQLELENKNSIQAKETNAAEILSLNEIISKKNLENKNLSELLHTSKKDLSISRNKIEVEIRQREEMVMTYIEKENALAAAAEEREKNQESLAREHDGLKHKLVNMETLLKTEEAERHKAMDNLSHAKSCYENEKEKLSREYVKKDRDREKLCLEISSLKKLLAEKENSADASSATISELKKRCNKMENKHQSAKKENTKLQEALAYEKQNNIAKALSNDTLESQLGSLREALTRSQAEFHEMKEFMDSDISAVRNELQEKEKQHQKEVKEREESVRKQFLKDNECLKEENIELLKKLENEANTRHRLDQHNKKLKDNMIKTEEHMRSEMNELHSAMKMAISRIEKKKSSKIQNLTRLLEGERASGAQTKECFEATIEELKYNTGYKENDEEKMILKEENSKLKHDLNKIRQKNATSPIVIDSTMNHDQLYIAWQKEKTDRMKAEEFAAIMAARAKAGIEEKNEKIVNLKMQLNLATNAKKAEHVKLLSDGSDIPVYGPLHEPGTLAMQDNALTETKKYRDLVEQQSQGDHMIDNDREMIEAHIHMD